MTRARISLTLELSWMFLSFHILFNLVMAAVACAVLARISGFEPSSEIIDPRYLEVDTVSSVWSLILMSSSPLCRSSLAWTSSSGRTILPTPGW